MTKFAITCTFLFAKFFGLRIGDYAYNKKSKHYLHWGQVQIFSVNDKNIIRFKTITGKHNKKGKLEILEWQCTCALYSRKICLACTMAYYQHLLLQKYGSLPYFMPVFTWETGLPITEYYVRQNLKTYLIAIKIKPDKYLTPHSFRYGCITDLMRAGVSERIVKKFARHSPRSVMTWYYTRMSAHEENYYS